MFFLTLPIFATSQAEGANEHIILANSFSFVPSVLRIQAGDTLSVVAAGPVSCGGSGSYGYGCSATEHNFTLTLSHKPAPPTLAICGQLGGELCSVDIPAPILGKGTVFIPTGVPSGTYSFYCRFHSLMTGTLIVDSPSIATGPPPDPPRPGSNMDGGVILGGSRVPVYQESGAAGNATLSGTADPGSFVSVVTSGESRTLLADPSGSWTSTFRVLEGQQSATLQTYSQGSPSPSVPVQPDFLVRLPPWIDLINPPVTPSGIGFNDWRFTNGQLTGRARPGSTVTISDAYGLKSEATSDSGGNWSLDIRSAARETLIAIRASDDVGTTPWNENPVLVDLSPPPPPRVDSPTAGTVYEVSKIGVSGQAMSPCRGYIHVKDNGNLVASQKGFDVGCGYGFTLTFSSGQHQLEVISTDPAGNKNSTHLTFTVNPRAVAIDAPANGTTINSSFVQLQGRADIDAAVRILNGTSQLASTVADSSGTWSSVLSLSRGAHTLVVEATNREGAVTTASITVNIGVTTSGPYDQTHKDLKTRGDASGEAEALEDGSLYAKAYADDTETPVEIEGDGVVPDTGSYASAAAGIWHTFTPPGTGNSNVTVELRITDLFHRWGTAWARCLSVSNTSGRGHAWPVGQDGCRAAPTTTIVTEAFFFPCTPTESCGPTSSANKYQPFKEKGDYSIVMPINISSCCGRIFVRTYIVAEAYERGTSDPYDLDRTEARARGRVVGINVV